MSSTVTNYVDSLGFYHETFPPLQVQPRAARNLELRPGQLAGIQTGGERLDFPVREETVVPGTPDAGLFETRLDEVSGGVYEFGCRGRAGDLAYRVESGALEKGIGVRWKGRDLGRFFSGSRLLGVDRADRAVSVVRREGEALYIEFEDLGARRMELIGPSLVLWIRAAGGQASGVDLGIFQGKGTWHALELPGLSGSLNGLFTMGWVTAEPLEAPCFVSSSFDWYRSNASWFEPVVHSNAWAFGRAVYQPGTDGRRTDIFERVVLTVSPRVEDTLVNVSNPPGNLVDELSSRMWVEGEGAMKLDSLGIGNVVHAHSTVTLDVMQANPVSESWDENHLIREPDWEWRAGRPGHFLRKAPLAVEASGGAFASSALSAGELCSVPPWRYVDFDSRVPGAATFGQAYYSIGEILRNLGRAASVPVVGDGGAEALYGGLAGGYLAGGFPEPFLPVFQLNRLQPITCRIGAGAVSPDRVMSDAELDRYLAGQIAYGAIGRLQLPALTDRQIFRAWSMMNAVQTNYTLRTPGRIAYWDGENYVSTSDAITGGGLGRSQLYMSFGESFELWVNGNRGEDWDVRVGEDRWRLPPYGWVAADDGFVAVSSLKKGQRMDYVECNQYTWFDGRGGVQRFRGISCPMGSVSIRRGPAADDSRFDLTHVGPAETIGIPVQRGVAGEAIAVRRAGPSGGGPTDIPCSLDDRTLLLDVPEGISRFEVFISPQ